MRTVIESPTFQQQAAGIWTEAERLAFVGWIARHPQAGDVIPGAEGARKVRWSSRSKGKRGGVRIIYFSLTEDWVVYLVTMYQKSAQKTIAAKAIKQAR